MAGVEAGLSTADSDIGIASASPLDIFNPVYPPEPEPVSRPTRYDVSRLGVYAVDQVRFGERLIVVPALRWSRLDIENRVATTGEARSTESVVSPSLGLVVLPRPWLSFYTTYAQGFEPPTPGQYLEDGRALTPAEHDSIEGGVKADLLDRRISVTGGAFRIRRTNVPEADAQGFFRQIGEAREPAAWSSRSSAASRVDWDCAAATPGRAPRSRATRAGLPAATCRMLPGTRRSCGCGIAFQRAH